VLAAWRALPVLQLTAHMNASYQARDGLPPELFPERVPVYLGHYHFPHLVPGTNITYIGSPYQGEYETVPISVGNATLVVSKLVCV
jgi:hypothetical protein